MAPIVLAAGSNPMACRAPRGSLSAARTAPQIAAAPWLLDRTRRTQRVHAAQQPPPPPPPGTKEQQLASKAPAEQQPKAAPPAAGGAGGDAAERLSQLLAWGQQQWAAMDLQQRASAVALGLLAVVALPKVLTLVVLGVERALIASLLAAEEALLELFYRGGIAVGGVAAVAVVLYAAYAFALPKPGGGGGGGGKS